MTEILPNLYLAGIEEVIEECETHAMNITHILNVASEIVTDRSFEYKYKHRGVIDDDDENDISQIFSECIDWIEEALSNDSKVIVHCWSGISRSVCVVLAYMIAKRGYTPEKALSTVMEKRPIIDPWKPYFQQLLRSSLQYSIQRIPVGY